MPGRASGPPRLAFLSPDWLDALGRAAGQVALPPELDLTLQQVVTGVSGPEGTEVRYHLVVEDGCLSVRPGQAPAPDLTLTQPYELAVALSRGDTNAQQALSAGRLRVSGNVELLVRHARALASVADVYAELRHATDY
ncbi:MAG: SCP2 sterol-binding domain-containing protein [Actinomycetota bacterium]|nr:SCP2 sterol-binding domain-containing protein [Actinomycetota bacterium]